MSFLRCIIERIADLSLATRAVASTVEPPIMDPPTSGQPLYKGHWVWHQLKLLQNLCFINLPRADASWFRTADKLRAPNWPSLYNSASYNGQTGNHTYLSCRNLIVEEYENFNIELQRSRGIAIAILGHRCLMGRLLLRSSMRLVGLVDQLSVHYDRMGITEQGVRGDNRGQINRFGFQMFQFQ